MRVQRGKEHYLKKYADILKDVEVLLDDTELIESTRLGLQCQTPLGLIP